MASHGVPRVAAVEPSEQSRKKDLKRIEAYKELVEQVDTHELTAETLGLISKLLGQNPEYYTVWNYRRLLLQDVFAKELAQPLEQAPVGEALDGEHDGLALSPPQQEISLLIKEDLAFLLPLLRHFPKCYWIWNHRAWLLQQASQHLPAASARRLWQEEMGLVTKMLGYDSRNFHGWGYRRQVVQALEDNSSGGAPQAAQDKAAGSSMAEEEFAYTTKMIKSNLSNFSAWHSRSQLIPRLLNERSADSTARRKLLDDELDLITQALYTDPYDQSLWFYHQYLMTTLTSSVPRSLTIVPDLNSQERMEYIELQIDSIKDMLEGTDDCKWIYQALLTTSAQYMELEAGNKKVTTTEMRNWLEELGKLDPLRKGRWQDWKRDLNL